MSTFLHLFATLIFSILNERMAVQIYSTVRLRGLAALDGALDGATD